MEQKKTTFTYKILRGIIRLVYPKTRVCGAENLPEEPVVLVGNHTQMNSPIICEFYMPMERYTWCAAQMMHWKEVPSYAFQDFWSQKPKYTHWFYKILSYVITPFSVCLFNNANTIPVYRDARLLSTFKTTVRMLDEGTSVVIFPEHDVKHNHIVYDFQDKFLDVAKLYYKRTGKVLKFVPMYIAPGLRQVHFGEPVAYDPAEPMDTQRVKLCNYLMDEITRVAESLPEHRVVPYRNIPKKFYPSNKESANENTRRGL